MIAKTPQDFLPFSQRKIISWKDMSWTIPEFSREQVNVAGARLISGGVSESEMEQSLKIVNNWRSSHSCLLQTTKMLLLGRAQKIDGIPLVAQRIKRIQTIKEKLIKQTDMKLSQMQDIGGCRAILKDVSLVEKLLFIYEKARAKNPNNRVEFSGMKNYILEPKIDGYRGIHLVYKYRTISPKLQVFSGLKIEIQLRSKLQHAWATAVEAMSDITKQSLSAVVPHLS